MSESVLELLRHLPDPAMIVDGAGMILHANRPFAELVGIRGKDLAGRLEGGLRLGGMLRQGTHVEVDLEAMVRSCLQTDRATQLADLTVKVAENERVMWTLAVPFGAAGRVLITMRDVTGEVKMQADLHRLLAAEKRRTEQLERAVETRTAELQQALVEVMRLANTDPLTGLFNRRAFAERVDRVLRTANRTGRDHALVAIDLDHFKAVNDTYGHDAGDRLLVATARAIEGTLRNTDILGRLGGEEFAVLLEEISPASALEVANRMRLAISAIDVRSILGGREAPQTASLGIAMYRRDGEDLDALLRAADIALYRAKGAGRDVVMVAQEGENLQPEPRRRTILAWAPSLGHPSELGGIKVHAPLTLEEALATASTASYEVVLAEATQHGLAVLEASCWQSPAALRLFILDDPHSLLRLDGGMVSVVDGIVLVGDVELGLARALEHASTRKQVLRDSLMRSIPRRILRETSQGLDMAATEVAIDGRFRVAMQPIVRLPDRVQAAAELLLRPLGGQSPADVCARAHERGLLGQLGRRIRRRAADLLAADPTLQLFVNVDATELLDAACFDEEHEILASSGRVVLEITERSSIARLGHIRDRIRRLRESGFRLAVDDLGSGYASLSALALLEPDFVKVDREIITDLPTAPRRRRLLELVVAFARDHGIQVVAEGIETAAELAVVEEIGCDLAQGYYLGRPVLVT